MFTIGPVIGSVRGNRVSILFEVSDMAAVEVKVTANGHSYWDSVIVMAKMPTTYDYVGVIPNMDYKVEISTEIDIRDGTFHTRYDGDIHVMSCNNQNKGDEHTLEIMSSKSPSLCLHIGDQVYSDYGGTTFKKAMKLDTYTEMVDCFRDMYRSSWSREVMRKILSSRCNAMMMDDHDITGSWDQKIRLPSNWLEIVSNGGWITLADSYRKKRHKAIIAGLQACSEYQLPLVGRRYPGSFSLSMCGKDILLLDLRTTRAMRAKEMDIDIQRHYDIIVSPVPIFMFPRWMLNRVSAAILRHIKIRDASDSWNLFTKHRKQIMSLIKLNNPILVCGDAHMCGETRIDGTHVQLTTSGVSTPLPPSILWHIMKAFRRYRIGGSSIEHIHWTRLNNFLSIKPSGEHEFFIV